MNLRFGGEGLRILDLDLECRPLSWYGGDFVTRDVTALAWSFVGSDEVTVRHTTGSRSSAKKMLEAFVSAYNEAGMVTGHYIRGFDLPVLNAALMELELPILGDKLSLDTKLDLVRASGLSKSQENLAAMLNLRAPKVLMTQADWREANRLTQKGIALAEERVVGDVIQHKELRVKMLERNLLGRPRVWTPQPSGTGRYSP